MRGVVGRRGGLGGSRWHLFALACLLLLPNRCDAGTVLLKVRHGIWPDHSRIVLDLSGETAFTQRASENPPQITIEIPGTSLAAGVSSRRIGDALVRGVRVERLRGPVTIVSIDLRRACNRRVFMLPAEGAAEARIVVDVYAGEIPATPVPDSTEAGEPPAVPEAIPAPSSEVPEAIPEPAGGEAPAAVSDTASGSDTFPAPGEEDIEEFTPTEALRVQSSSTAPGGNIPAAAAEVAGRADSSDAAVPPDTGAVTVPRATTTAPHRPTRRLVAIDAGHGGDDTGARRGTIEEKRICLDFAKRLAAAINRVDGYQACLTRSTDEFIPLRRRYQLAENNSADVFISIHANAAPSRAASGTEVFFLSLGGASDEAARELAQKENASDEIGGVTPEAEEDVVSIIRDLRRSDALRRSSFLAESVLEELQKIPGVESRGVKQAGFTVLKSAEMPSILVETGFLSNTTERNRLRDPDYQDVFVRRLRDGVLAYFQRYGLAQP